MIAEQFDAFLFDLDGVIYVGDEVVPGAKRTLGRLRNAGKTLRFLTNDPRPTRRAVARRLRGMGVRAEAREIVTCGWATAIHLKATAVETTYVVGSEGLKREIEAKGIDIMGRGAIHAVVVGCDERIAYPHIRRATRLVRRGARFIATNDDPTFPTPEGPAPATGAIVAAVCAASECEPRVIGKPSPEMFTAALKGIETEGAVMIGDRLATDIAGAKRHGITTLWFNRGGARALPDDPPAQPSGLLKDLTELFSPNASWR